MRLYGMAYRAVMKVAHRFHWHYAPPIFPEGDTQLWCKWCGFRETIHRRGDPETLEEMIEVIHRKAAGK